MANLNLDRDVANELARKKTIAHKLAISYPLQQAAGMRRYGSLINIKPSGCIGLFLHFFPRVLWKGTNLIMDPKIPKMDVKWEQKGSRGYGKNRGEQVQQIQ